MTYKRTRGWVISLLCLRVCVLTYRCCLCGPVVTPRTATRHHPPTHLRDDTLLCSSFLQEHQFKLSTPIFELASVVPSNGSPSSDLLIAREIATQLKELESCVVTLLRQATAFAQRTVIITNAEHGQEQYRHTHDMTRPMAMRSSVHQPATIKIAFFNQRRSTNPRDAQD